MARAGDGANASTRTVPVTAVLSNLARDERPAPEFAIGWVSQAALFADEVRELIMNYSCAFVRSFSQSNCAIPKIETAAEWELQVR
ncbi:hypothetical protein C7I55_09350 [Sphingomonas deserti]|uniref:Uncharacterized protein n=1 Tax=Allosphingosinicella deserti TaxID=2116704 RepID=A0A2P7QRB7_9SPHN|nr:hypothetical protein C7I55_09350 [Sphingomonas deserti]